MKKIAVFLILFSTLFTACETDFDVNASWKEVTVVYGLLDQSQEQQYIKINKAFLGEGNALQMASISDSVNYNPADLEVKIIKVKDGSFGSVIALDTIDLDTTLIIKDDGLFATDENIIYTTPSNFFLTNNADEKDYILSIVNKKSGQKVWAKTNLIHELMLDIPGNQPMGFYANVPNPPVSPLEKTSTTVKWYHSKNGKIYQIIARIHYKDYFNDGTVSSMYLDWLQPQIIFENTNEMHYTFKGDAFVNTLANNLTVPANLKERRLIEMELLFTVGSEDLQTYISVNEPFEGIVQERPVFTNINNGIGLFTSRYNKSHIMEFSSTTKEGIEFDLDSLGFVDP